MQYALSWTRVDDDILIRDRRIGFPRRDYRLRNGAVRVFHELDSPAALKSVIRRLGNGTPSGKEGPNGPGALDTPQPGSSGNGVNHSRSGFWSRKSRTLAALWNSRPAKVEIISFEVEAFTRDPEACLAPMVDAGLVWVEDGRYLALPVREDPNRRRLSVEDFI
jgi:hypothetical protein